MPKYTVEFTRGLALHHPDVYVVKDGSNVLCECDTEANAQIIAESLNTLPDVQKRLHALQHQISIEGCAAAHAHEITFECDILNPCGLCRLRFKMNSRPNISIKDAQQWLEAHASDDGQCSACEIVKDKLTSHALGKTFLG